MNEPIWVISSNHKVFGNYYRTRDYACDLAAHLAAEKCEGIYSEIDTEILITQDNEYGMVVEIRSDLDETLCTIRVTRLTKAV